MSEALYLKQIVDPLLAWYEGSRRILPWREDPTAYHVWISEIMLQQTRVEAVKPYYHRFMESLPDVDALASCEEDRLLKLWEGLGYYSRARNLKKAAETILLRYDGKIPEEYTELLKLPGIGSYTAGAVSSIAYGKPVPAVDGNVLRVISRLIAGTLDISAADTRKRIFNILLDVIPEGRAGDFNQALMEIGALVCLPGRPPLCEKCPLSGLCIASVHKLTDVIPVKAPSRRRVIEQKTVLIVRDGSHTLIRKRSEKGLLSGLYEPPVLEGWADKEEVIRYLNRIGADPVRILPLPDAKHVFTHIEWHMKGFVVLVQDLEKFTDGKDLFSVSPEEIAHQYPVPTAYAAYTGFLQVVSGYERVLEYYYNQNNNNGGFS